MTLGELFAFADEKEKRRLDLWYIARWMIFWIMPGLTKKSKPITYYLDIDKVIKQNEKASKGVSKKPGVTRKQIEIWKKIDAKMGRKVDYSDHLKELKE